MSVAVTVSSTPPDITILKLRDVLKKTEIYSVHPEVLGLISSSPKEQEHAAEVLAKNANLLSGKKPQTEFLVVKFPKSMTAREVGDAVDLLYSVRNKLEGISPNKVHGIADKGFVLVYEASAIYLLRKMLPPNFVKDSGYSGRSAT